jgi:hypothetical protein
MDKAVLLEKVRELRGLGNSPKQIARALGLSPAVVAPLIRAVAEQAREEAPLGELVGCWISRGWSVGLSVEGWSDLLPEVDDSIDTAAGLVGVLIARKHGWDKLVVCGYLVDAYCLGVKNAQGPDIQDELELRQFRELYFSAFPYGYQDATLELALHMVFGAADYAHGLGFDPHPDFAAVHAYLGEWAAGSSAITFGKNGKPFYVSGPYDDTRKIIKTLTRAVGKPPNFDYVLVAG